MTPKSLWSFSPTLWLWCSTCLCIIPAIAAPNLALAETLQPKSSPTNSMRPKRDRDWNTQLAVPEAVRVSKAVPAVPPLQDLAIPQNSLNIPSNQIAGMEPVTSVSQLSDVKSTDWAFQALQSLVERYGAIAGYPDRQFRGDRALTRYEFAAGLNTVLDKVNALTAAGLADKVSQSDLAILQKLQAEFSQELTTLRGSVDSLEKRTAIVENQQFSPITKLRTIIAFLIGDTFGERPPRGSNTVFQSYASLNFQTSFTGKDMLNVRLVGTNTPSVATATGSFTSNLLFDPPVSPNSIRLDRLDYKFPIGDRATVWIVASGLQPYDWVPVVNPLISLVVYPNSRFSLWNPASYRLGFLATGIGAAYRFNDWLQVHAGYFGNSDQASIPTGGNGLFNGNNGIIAQLTFTASREFEAALTYTHKYFTANTVNLQSTTGSIYALTPFDQNATSADNFSVEFSWKLSPNIHFGGWFGYTSANQLSRGNSSATILNGALNLAFIDLFSEGSVGGLIVGVPPKVTSSNYIDSLTRALRQDLDTPIHVEVFYNYRLTKNISIMPDIFVVTNPDRNGDPIWVGSLRTVFSF
ncbi:iron uptake porin [Tumidithrix elongata RA019]|uniref:Iron uptake porin n=1 Tax=Tumidithrix elongata BACA0141 TaxID=2716417 RepID=A0AAW9PVV6_9CYAN|nr:iron uptake porin [Tumidithrix elongata RA019]